MDFAFQPDPNAAAWADLWDWIDRPPGLAAPPAPLSRRTSSAAAGLAALRAASLSLASPRSSLAAGDTVSPTLSPTRAASQLLQAQERLEALQLQTEPWRVPPAETAEQHVPLSSDVALTADAASEQEAAQIQPTDSQQAGRAGSVGLDVADSAGVQASAFAAGSLNVASDGAWSSSDGSAGSPVRAVLPPIATSLPAPPEPAAAARSTGASTQPGALPMPRGNSDPSLDRPAAAGLPEDLPVYAASADGLVSPLASAGRIDLSGETGAEKGHFVITAGGLVNPAANAGRIVLELDATDTDKFMALQSGIVSPTARSGRIILLPEEPAK